MEASSSPGSVASPAKTGPSTLPCRLGVRLGSGKCSVPMLHGAQRWKSGHNVSVALSLGSWVRVLVTENQFIELEELKSSPAQELED